MIDMSHPKNQPWHLKLILRGPHAKSIRRASWEGDLNTCSYIKYFVSTGAFFTAFAAVALAIAILFVGSFTSMAMAAAELLKNESWSLSQINTLADLIMMQTLMNIGFSYSDAWIICGLGRFFVVLVVSVVVALCACVLFVICCLYVTNLIDRASAVIKRAWRKITPSKKSDGDLSPTALSSIMKSFKDRYCERIRIH